MLIDILFIVLGIYIVLKGADFLTDGAVSLAQRMDMPEMIIDALKLPQLVMPVATLTVEHPCQSSLSA